MNGDGRNIVEQIFDIMRDCMLCGYNDGQKNAWFMDGKHGLICNQCLIGETENLEHQI